MFPQTLTDNLQAESSALFNWNPSGNLLAILESVCEINVQRSGSTAELFSKPGRDELTPPLLIGPSSSSSSAMEGPPDPAFTFFASAGAESNILFEFCRCFAINDRSGKSVQFVRGYG